MEGVRVVRRFVSLVCVAAVLVACGPGAEEVDAVVSPIEDVVDELEDFLFKIEGGLTYGDVRSEWPVVTASVRRQINDLDDLDFTILSEDQADAAMRAVTAAAGAHDLFGLMAQAVGDYIQQEGDEAVISRNLDDAIRRLDAARDALDELDELTAA